MFDDSDDEGKRLRAHIEGTAAADDDAAEPGSSSLGDVLRERGRPSRFEADDADIGSVWAAQERMQKEDAWLALQYKQTKERAKQLKKQLRQNQLGEDELLSGKIKESVGAVLAKPGLKKAASGLKFVPWARYARYSRVVRLAKTLRGVVGFVLRSRRHLAGALGVVVVISLLSFRLFVGGPGATEAPVANGDNEPGTETGSSQVAGVADEKPSFTMIFPEGKTAESYKVVKVSPEGNDPVFAYLDELDRVQLRVSQQQLPEAFSSNPMGELEKTAKNFQAVNVIQIDSTLVYHGLNERTGVQSLVFIKNNLLVFIAAATQIPDDNWVGYIAGMQ